ncbi:MAG: carbon-nitrogen hydrolase family protein [Clostridia bacterium]|nr:carbon-nitrogen hydrolase family protein [Clostridia bacterium]
MKITVIQPPYFAGESPDEVIANFLIEKLNEAEGDLIVLPEYSNAGGLSDPEKEIAALPRAEKMLSAAKSTAKQKGCLVAVNVLEKRNGKLQNSTYLYNKNGEIAFVYDKIHLPPSEVNLNVSYGDGNCTCEIDGIRFGFMTCYDVYYNEQIEHIAAFRPDVILIPGYQRGERTDIITAQAKLTAFRCNAYVARSSYSMNDDEKGGNSMIVAPDGQILNNMGKEIGFITEEVDIKWKHTRPAGFGCGIVRNDDFINDGLRPQVFTK